MSGTTQSKFAVNDHVRVKRGVTDFDYADMPLGGWAGIVIEIERGDCTTCLVCWSEVTLAAIAPFYQERCPQDGIDSEEKWLEEGDLERDDGRPLDIERRQDTPAWSQRLPCGKRHEPADGQNEAS
jgi:hypothetical protein